MLGTMGFIRSGKSVLICLLPLMVKPMAMTVDRLLVAVEGVEVAVVAAVEEEAFRMLMSVMSFVVLKK
jgi:hypothetical protein